MIKAAVLGSPIDHSLSPLLHQLAYRELGISGEYSKLEVPSGELSTFLASLDDSWTGFSLTMPLKEEIVDCVNNVSPLSKKIRSANTLYRTSGEWNATTTDVSGFIDSLQSHGVEISGNVVIIGAGATARAAAAACDASASHITIMARSSRGADEIFKSVDSTEMNFVSWGDEESIQAAQLIISTTPEGATDSLIQIFPTKPDGIFFDVLYKPWPTQALATWQAKKGQVIDGLDLLIHQAISQVEIFAGLSVDRTPMAQLMRKAAFEALSSST